MRVRIKNLLVRGFIISFGWRKNQNKTVAVRFEQIFVYQNYDSTETKAEGLSFLSMRTHALGFVRAVENFRHYFVH